VTFYLQKPVKIMELIVPSNACGVS
jgi:hypothetical protein